MTDSTHNIAVIAAQVEGLKITDSDIQARLNGSTGVQIKHAERLALLEQAVRTATATQERMQNTLTWVNRGLWAGVLGMVGLIFAIGTQLGGLM